MKIKTTIESITHDDLVELFSAALYGSDIFGVDYDAEVYNQCPDKKSDDCLEDKVARILLNDGSITISDCYAEDEDDFYGELRHEYDSSYQHMDYIVNIQDIKKGLAKCASGDFEVNDGFDNEKQYISKCFNDLLACEGNLDLFEAQNLLQIILFGKLIYG